MNTESLKAKLRDIGISKRLYEFDFQKSFDDCYCLIKTKTHWEVFYVERGKKKLIVQFEYEFQACDYLYGIMLRISEDT